jgi:hypothetical protein
MNFFDEILNESFYTKRLFKISQIKFLANFVSIFIFLYSIFQEKLKENKEKLFGKPDHKIPSSHCTKKNYEIRNFLFYEPVIRMI